MDNKLKFTRKEIFSIEYDDWDKFVNNYFNLNDQYEIAVIEEKINDSNFEMRPDGIINDYDQADLEMILKGDIPPFCTGVIMNHFVKMGILDKDKVYQINISW